MSTNQLGRTPSQTIGPFFKFGTEWIANEDVVPTDYPDSFILKGIVYDGAGNPVTDGMVEIFQANENGNFQQNASESWSGFARRLTDENGSYAIRTIKPGEVKTSYGDMQAPHILMVVFARGLLKPVYTRIYFPDETERNANDPLLSGIVNEEARGTMFAVMVSEKVFEFDVRLQGSTKGPETQFIEFGI